MGKLKKIPTRWFVQMLKDTRDVEISSPERLERGRKVLIEKLLSRVGSPRNGMIEGVRNNVLFRPSEFEDYKINSVTNN